MKEFPLNHLFTEFLVLQLSFSFTNDDDKERFRASSIDLNIGHYVEAAELPLMFREEAFRRNLQDIVAADAFLRSQAPRYRSLRVPVIAIAGDRDAVVSPAHSVAIARDAPAARLIALPGVGHMPHRTKAQTIAKAIKTLMPQP